MAGNRVRNIREGLPDWVMIGYFLVVIFIGGKMGYGEEHSIIGLIIGAAFGFKAAFVTFEFLYELFGDFSDTDTKKSKGGYQENTQEKFKENPKTENKQGENAKSKKQRSYYDEHHHRKYSYQESKSSGNDGNYYWSKNPNESDSAFECYTILNCHPQDSMAKIKRSYYKLMKKYHPDHLGNVSEAEYQYYTEQTQKINAAYDCIKKIQDAK